MKTLFLTLFMGLLIALASAQTLPAQETSPPRVTQKPLTIERLYASPDLSGPKPAGLKYSPDGQRVTFLKAREDESDRFDLWQFDVATGAQSLLIDSKLLEPEEVELSEEEKALRERKRIAGRKGIVDYHWGAADTILVPSGGDLFLITILPGLTEGDIKVSLRPDASQYGITVADVSRRIREAYFGEVQRIPRDNDVVLMAPSTQPQPRVSDLTIAAPDGSEVSIKEVAEFRYVEPSANISVRRLTESDSYEYDAKVSPDGLYVSYVRDGAVYAIDFARNVEVRQTPLAEPLNAISYGVAEFVAQEEMDRFTGYWWSPDSKYLAYTRVDESMVDIIPRFDIAAEDVTVIEQRYPRAGRPNAKVDLFVRNMETGEAVQIDWVNEDWGEMAEEYLARVYWAGGKVIIQAVNRDQTVIRTLRGDPDTGELESLWAESQTNWVNLNTDWIEAGDKILTSMETFGFRHVIALNNEGESEFRVTSGDWPVYKVEGADAALNVVFLSGYMDTPLERHLYRTPITPHEFDVTPYAASVRMVPAPPPVRITQTGKSWDVKVAPDGNSFVGISSSPDQPPQTGLYRMDGSRIAWIEENQLDAGHPYAPYRDEHTVPEYGTLTAEDGQTLHYSIQTPPDFDPAQKYPVLVEVYGGPHVQTVTRDWERLSDQFYSRKGYVVFRLDNRGSANRGKVFEDVIYRTMGVPEVRDQLAGVAWLKSQPFVDPDRIGIQGWSYGGYMTLMTILQAPKGTFAAAVAGAPVTDWSLYDTFYTERYMETPQINPEGYEASSVFYHLDRFEGELPALLLMHGMADDNVTFDNTTRLMAALQERAMPFELMTYPGQRHGIRGEALQVHLMTTRMAFLDRQLKSTE